MRGRDHRPTLVPEVTREEGHGRGGHDAEGDHVAAGRADSCGQGCLQELAGGPRVSPHRDARTPLALLGQRDHGRPSQAEGELAGELAPRHAPDAVGAEKAAHVGYLTDTMAGENPGETGSGRASGRLVRVLTTPTVPEGLLARGILQSEGIPVLTKGEGEGPYRMGPVQLWVPEELEVQARLVLEARIPAGDDPPEAGDVDEADPG